MMKVFKDTSFGDGKAITFFNPRTYTQIYPATYKGGGWSPQSFWYLQYFETILPSVESLWTTQQDEACFMGVGAAGGLWRHQQWSPSWILPRIRNQVKIAINGNFFVLDM